MATNEGTPESPLTWTGGRAAATGAVVLAGVVLGVVGDLLLREPDGLGLNLAAWIAAVAVAALVLQYRLGSGHDRGRVGWLVAGALFGAALMWRDAPFLKLLTLTVATMSFALAAHRLTTAWIRRAGVTHYAGALALGALHAWMAGVIVLVDVMRVTPPFAVGAASSWRRGLAFVRGLAIALPVLGLFGLLFMSADAVFARMVADAFRFDLEQVISHVIVFSVLTWIGTGYLRGFLYGTDIAWVGPLPNESVLFGLLARRPALGRTEIAMVLGSLNLLFLLFVAIQFRYLFGGATLVQISPNLTYADYARRGFFELVTAVALVVPLLLAMDWLRSGAAGLFRALAGAQVVLVLAVAASAFERLRLYYSVYGLTEARFYAMALLAWIAVMLVWLALTVLRDRRDRFAVGALLTACASVALFFVINPDAFIARANLARLTSTDATVRFDVAYATTLSADAVPVLVQALPTLPADVQCRLARHMLRRWSPGQVSSIRSWNWSAAHARDAVRTHAAQLQAAVGPSRECATDDGSTPP